MTARKGTALPRPGPSSLAIIDQAIARIRPDDEELRGWTKNYFQEHRKRFAVDLELVARFVPAESLVLDVGAAPYVITTALQAQAYQVAAVDVNPSRFAAAISDLALTVHACDIECEALPFEDASVDAVLFNELFEHLRIDPIHTLEEVYRVLKPGGLLLLSTPNLRSFRGLKNLLLKDQALSVSGGVYRQYEKLRTLGHMGHVREYTTTETIAFLDQIGFAIEALLYRGGHGRGIVGLAERLAPSFLPFFSIVAQRPGQASGHHGP
ncbi:MAG: class I SAM-dependent methyltransferase [Pseudomonadota bacterium]